MKSYTDANLFSLIAKSDHHAFEELHLRFWKPLYQLAYKKIGDADEAGDLLQDMFLELWEKRESIAFSNAVESWLRNRLWFKIAMYFRQKGFSKKHQDSFSDFFKHQQELVVHADSMELKEADLHYQEILAVLNGCIATMPDRMKEIFMMSRADDRPVKEIAQLLQISPKTVKVQLERATARLRAVASKENLSPVDLLFLLWLINC